jgi:hypothetical protein
MQGNPNPSPETRFQPGNPGRPPGSKNKPKWWEAAIMEAIAEAEGMPDGPHLKAIARALLLKAASGDVPAIKEVGDRTDGKVPQALTGANDGPLELTCRWATSPPPSE